MRKVQKRCISWYEGRRRGETKYSYNNSYLWVKVNVRAFYWKGEWILEWHVFRVIVIDIRLELVWKKQGLSLLLRLW